LKTKSQLNTIGFVSLGCSKNLIDSEQLTRQIEASHIKVIFDPERISGYDTVIINTCGFIGDAKQESINTILQFVEAKRNGYVSRVFVIGCLSQRYRQQLEIEIPEVDAFYGVNEMEQIIRKIGGHYKKELIGERSITTLSHYEYLKISEGCTRKCSFCAIPLIRGKHISKPIENILNESKFLIKSGVKEINLISQDTAYYGIDLYHEKKLPELVENLALLPGLEWLRIHYVFPDGFPMKVLDIMNRHTNICKYLDIPLQHINDRILKSMHRNITADKTKKLIDTIRHKVPGIGLRTTLMVGYPGETDKEFKELLNFVNEYKFDRLGVFNYSHEENTKAFSLIDNVPEKVKQQRADEIMDAQGAISYQLNMLKVGKTIKVLVDRISETGYIARSEMDSPEVDNEIMIKKSFTDPEPGQFCEVKIIGSEDFDLYAEMV